MTLVHLPQRPLVPARPRGSNATTSKRLRLRLWAPLSLLWVLLAPFALILAAAAEFTPLADQIPPFLAVRRLGEVLFALSGTLVEVDTPTALISVRIL